MEAPRRGRRTRVSSSRMVVPFLLVVLLAGLPIRGISAEITTQSKSPTAKECRAHVEKALDQYFETKESPSTGDQAATKSEEKSPECNPITTNVDVDDDDDDDDDNNTPLTKEETDDDDDDDDEDDDEDDDHKSTDDNDDDDDDDDDSDDDGITKSPNESTKMHKQENMGDDDENDDDNDDDDEDDDDKTDSNVKDTENIKISKFSPESYDDQSKSYGEQKAAQKEIDDEKIKNTEDNDDDDDDDDDDEDNDDDDGDDDDDEQNKEKKDTVSSPNTSKENTAFSSDKKTEGIQRKTESFNLSKSGDNDGDDDDDDNDDDEDGDEEENVKDKPEKLAKKDEDDDYDEKEKKVTITREPPTPHKPTTVVRISRLSKVTGASNIFAARMASKLSKVQSTPYQPKAQKIAQKAPESLKKTPVEGKISVKKSAEKIPDGDDDDDDDEDDDDDAIENIYEDDEDESIPAGTRFRSRNHIDVILGLDEIGTDYHHQEDKLAQSIFRDIKRIHATSIKPMEMLYKYTDSTTRYLGDAEIFSKPMVLFLGPWSTGKTTIINYLLGIERTPTALKTGTGITDVDFTVITYGDQRQTISGTELAADWHYSSLQRFGQGFLDHFKAVTIPHTLLKKINIVDTPGILENRKNTERGYSFNDAFQWFIDRADAIYVVLDPSKVDIGAELAAVLDQLKGRDVRFILNKADTIRRTDLMKVVGQLFWNLSPLMSGTEAPIIYAVSLSTKPFNPSAPAKFLSDQENNFLYDLKDAINKRVENKILYARRHAVRVRNHAKMVDCYLSTYYRHKSIFSSKRNVAKLITENPSDYHIYEGLSSMSNVSRYDLPDPATYKNFFKMHSLYDFKPLASTCSYFRGCPMDKLDNAIANELPELFTKYKKDKNGSPQPATKQNER